MGLFDFFRKSTKKNEAVETANEAARVAEANRADAINMRDILASTGIPVKDLDVEIDGQKVTVYGQTPSKEDKDKLIMVLGNMDNVNSVDDRISVVEPEPQFETYTVKSGDSLSKIAKELYGDPMEYKKIFEANTDILDDPNMIHPGQELKIPR
jgi:nucleoid-associated protein YgaU